MNDPPGGIPMKTVSAFFLCLSCVMLFVGASSTDAQDHSARFQNTGKLFASGEHEKALEQIRELDQVKNLDDTLKKDVRWAYLSSLAALSKAARNQEQWAKAKKFTEESVKVLENSKNDFEGEFLEQLNSRKFWAYKNMVLCCTGLGELDQVKTYREKLYEGYRKKKLPEGIDECFNFDFVRIDGKNVWGYEYFPPSDGSESKGGFSKYVYHIFRAKEDGTDGEGLFRLHAVTIHKLSESDVDLYVLTLRWMEDGLDERRSLFEHVYHVPIDMKKLRNDIREFVKANPKLDKSAKALDKGKMLDKDKKSGEGKKSDKDKKSGEDKKSGDRVSIVRKATVTRRGRDGNQSGKTSRISGLTRRR